MRILLLDFHHYKATAANLKTQNSLTLMQLASLIPDKHQVIAIDNPNELDLTKNYDLVAISTITPSAFDAYKIADEYRSRGTKVVIGGWHATALPNEAKEHADAVFIGESEATWPQFLIDFQNGEHKDFYKQNTSIFSNSVIYPKRNIFKNTKPIAPIQAIRGCSVGCDYCCISNYRLGNRSQYRPISEVVNEIKSIKQKSIYFCGPSVTINPVYSKDLFQSIKDLNKSITCYGNINVLGKDDEFLRLASDAGCLYWIVGFESISQDTIDSFGKQTNIVKKYKDSIKKVHDYNMSIIGSFVFGFDSDYSDVFSNTYEFVKESNIDLPVFIILTPYPGTPMFDRLEAEGRIITKDWSKYDLRTAVFKPKNMDPEFIEEEIRKLYRKFYSFYPTFKRVIKNINRGFHPFFLSFYTNLKCWSAKGLHEYSI